MLISNPDFQVVFKMSHRCYEIKGNFTTCGHLKYGIIWRIFIQRSYWLSDYLLLKITRARQDATPRGSPGDQAGHLASCNR